MYRLLFFTTGELKDLTIAKMPLGNFLHELKSRRKFDVSEKLF